LYKVKLHPEMTCEALKSITTIFEVGSIVGDKVLGIVGCFVEIEAGLVACIDGELIELLGAGDGLALGTPNVSDDTRVGSGDGATLDMPLTKNVGAKDVEHSELPLTNYS